MTWAQRLDQRPDEIEHTVIDLLKLGICSFSAWRFGWTFERVAAIEPDWDGLEQLIEKRRALVRRRTLEARALARGHPDCRRREMLQYLGETDPPDVTPVRCGTCDACTPELPRPWHDSPVALEDAADALREEAEAIALVLIDGVERGQWSRAQPGEDATRQCERQARAPSDAESAQLLRPALAARRAGSPGGDRRTHPQKAGWRSTRLKAASMRHCV